MQYSWILRTTGAVEKEPFGDLTDLMTTFQSLSLVRGYGQDRILALWSTSSH